MCSFFCVHQLCAKRHHFISSLPWSRAQDERRRRKISREILNVESTENNIISLKFAFFGVHRRQRVHQMCTTDNYCLQNNVHTGFMGSIHSDCGRIWH
jgi:hypothetical protein